MDYSNHINVSYLLICIYISCPKCVFILRIQHWHYLNMAWMSGVFDVSLSHQHLSAPLVLAVHQLQGCGQSWPVWGGVYHCCCDCSRYAAQLAGLIELWQHSPLSLLHQWQHIQEDRVVNTKVDSSIEQLVCIPCHWQCCLCVGCVCYQHKHPKEL